MNLTKLSLSLTIALLATNTYASINANPGFYFGGAISATNSSSPPGASLAGTLDSALNVGLRPTIGYRFNDYVAIEAGYLNAASLSTKAGQGSWGSNVFGPDELQIYSFDAAIKGIVPFQSGFSLFAKGGLALTHQYVYNKIFVNDPTPIVNESSNHIQPIVGAGVSYNFTKNFATELSYTYYAPSGNINKMNMFALGLTYTFGGSDT